MHGSGRIKGKMCEQQHQHNYDSIQKAPIKTCDSGFVRIATLNFNASVHKYKKGCYKLLRHKYSGRSSFHSVIELLMLSSSVRIDFIQYFHQHEKALFNLFFALLFIWWPIFNVEWKQATKLLNVYKLNTTASSAIKITLTF